jgi:hypothetical protein
MMMTKKRSSSIVATMATVILTMATSSSHAFQHPMQLNDIDMPDTGEHWSTLQNGVEFQPGNNLSPLAQEHLRRLTTTNNDESDFTPSEYEKIFVDGMETYYAEYAQAWRALGFYIDCDYCDPDKGCWWQTANGNSNNNNNNNDNNGDDDHDQPVMGCQRFMLWAAVSKSYG